VDGRGFKTIATAGCGHFQVELLKLGVPALVGEILGGFHGTSNLRQATILWVLFTEMDAESTLSVMNVQHW
jgi:hypothetical protein